MMHLNFNDKNDLTTEIEISSIIDMAVFILSSLKQ